LIEVMKESTKARWKKGLQYAGYVAIPLTLYFGSRYPPVREALARIGIYPTALKLVGSAIGVIGVYGFTQRFRWISKGPRISLSTAGGMVGWAYPISTSVAAALIHNPTRARIWQFTKLVGRKVRDTSSSAWQSYKENRAARKGIEPPKRPRTPKTPRRLR